MEPATTYQNLGLPPEWYGALEWVFPTWARTHALDKGEAVNILKGAIVTADRIATVSQVILQIMLYFHPSIQLLLDVKNNFLSSGLFLGGNNC